MDIATEPREQPANGNEINKAIERENSQIIEASATRRELIQPVGDNGPNDVEKFILAAINNNVPMETMEKLLAMRRELRMEQAKSAFDTSLASFQAACPIIKKDKKVKFESSRTGNETSYSYAPLDSIIGQVKGLLKEHGFSYSMTAAISDDGWVEATCKLSHVAAHSECSSFKVPIDKAAFMNAQQKVAAALTYAKRYAFCNATGIMTGDEDDDANGATGKKEPEPRRQAPKKKEPPPLDERLQDDDFFKGTLRGALAAPPRLIMDAAKQDHVLDVVMKHYHKPDLSQCDLKWRCEFIEAVNAGLYDKRLIAMNKNGNGEHQPGETGAVEQAGEEKKETKPDERWLDVSTWERFMTQWENAALDNGWSSEDANRILNTRLVMIAKLNFKPGSEPSVNWRIETITAAREKRINPKTGDIIKVEPVSAEQMRPPKASKRK